MTRKAKKSKYYVVWKGRRPGIFSTWEECSAQVSGYPGARYKAFDTRLQAERAWKGDVAAAAARPASSQRWLFGPDSPVPESLCVDAACSGSPGPLEYRGVSTATGKEIFRQGPFENGTNNVGEFLAIVHALQWLAPKKSSEPVYSDSETGIKWVRRKKCNTTLAPDGRNQELFRRIAKAEAWLRENELRNPILKWDTHDWGEIPADFNRK